MNIKPGGWGMKRGSHSYQKWWYSGNIVRISIVNGYERGLVNTALRSTDSNLRCASLRCQIDNIKGPLKVHGFCLYMQKLKIVKCGMTLKVGASDQLFDVLPYSLKAPGTCMRPCSSCLPSPAWLHTSNMRQLRRLFSTLCRRMGCASWTAEPRILSTTASGLSLTIIYLLVV